MKSRSMVAGMTLAAALLATGAFGDTVDPGSEGEVGMLLKPVPGARVCYARSYSVEHLAGHPRQTITDIEFRLTYFRHDPDDFFPQGQRNYYFHVEARRRGEAEVMVSAGECGPLDGRISCGVDCDGGGFTLERRPGDKLLLDLGENGRLRMSAGCDGGETIDVDSGAADRSFLMSRADDAACPAYEKWYE